MSLSKILEEYREGLRGLPTYEELAAIAASAPMTQERFAEKMDALDKVNPEPLARLMAATEQCADPIVERNVSMLRQRSTVGVQKYGVTLADNKLPLRAWLNHALEESLDQANYLQAAMAEIDSAAVSQVVADERKTLDEIADLFSIGAEARKEPGVILANVRNTVKFANLLHAVEREFFMSPDDENECLVNCWGSTTEQYLSAMRAALQAAPVQAQEPVRSKSEHPSLSVPIDPACSAKLDDLGDDRGQGLNSYWKSAFRAGWKYGQDAIRSAPVQPVAGLDGAIRVAAIKDAVNRFLGWKLPLTFSPDNGIEFDKPPHLDFWPIGTNLFTADEAKAMFEHCISAPLAQDDVTQAAIDVLSERRRQVKSEGWTPERDDKYTREELCFAADSYLMAGDGPHEEPPTLWPWESFWWKPSDNRRNMVKAGALILAEIERLDRSAIAAKATPEQQ